MLLWGRIEEFPLTAVFQFLAMQRKSGCLVVEDYEDRGNLYFDRGRLALASMPEWDEKLEARLISSGLLDERRARACWMLAAEEGETKPVAAYLLEAASAELEKLEDVLEKHLGDVVLQLMFWNLGNFSLRAQDQQFTLPMIRPLDVDTLLLDAYRRIDEGERPWREKVALESDLCLTCTMECTAEIKDRYLRKDICLWRAMPTLVRESMDRGEKRKRRLLEEEDFDEDLPFL